MILLTRGLVRVDLTRLRTRDQHVAWCQQNARRLLGVGDRRAAVRVLLDDLGRHRETAPLVTLRAAVKAIAAVRSDQAVHAFIDGFR